ncbi:MAG: NAD-dependent epimerase/dehydratase family protein [Deltaproteobacteria bacterium]|nr:NAD-dependent epimerase/dehydratase family protein [Deltaproteobacteria bacterium]
MRWLVTGADKMVGRAVLRAVLDVGDEAIAIGSANSQSIAHDRVTYRDVDWRDDDDLARVTEGVEVIAHTDVGDPWSLDRKACEEQVLVRTEALLDAANRAGARRFLFRSSERVTSSGEPRRTVNERLAHSWRWLSPWDEMMSIAEGVVCAHAGASAGIALRAGLVWGEGDDESLPRFVGLSERKALVLPSGPDTTLVTTHARNLAQAFLCASMAHNIEGSAYWISDGEWVFARKFLTRWLASAGAKAPRRGLMPLRVADLLARWEQHHGGMSRAELALVGVTTILDGARAHNELAYEPLVSIDEGLAALLRAKI